MPDDWTNGITPAVVEAGAKAIELAEADLADRPIRNYPRSWRRTLTLAVLEATAPAIAAAERDEIIRLAVEHGACYYAEPRPCGHKADCSLVTRDRVPFADLIRKERGNA